MIELRNAYLIIIPLALAALSSCARSSNEEQIRAVIEAAETAFEARDTSAAMELIADDFRDDQGTDKEHLRNYLRAYFLAHPKIELLVRIKELRIETETRARLQVEATLLGTEQAGGASTLAADTETLRVELMRVDGKWLVVRVERTGE